jgi:signal transduction histidine kinase
MKNLEDKTSEELIKELQTLEIKYSTLAKLYSTGIDNFDELNDLLKNANEEKSCQEIELDDARKKIALQNKEKKLSAEATNELEAFSYSVSHDLRAPLRHISGFVDLLLSRYYDEMPDKAKHYLQNIAQSTQQMDTLINELLEFSRTGRKKCSRPMLI